MPDSALNEAQLSALKARWEQDPGARIYLQLAEEYRKLGRHADAVIVLQKGLEKSPRDLSGLVALGRCRLEMGEVAGATEIFQGVVQRDAMHIVANKLLVDCHLRQGNESEARSRLDICRLLSDSDPDLETFEQRLRQLSKGAREASEEGTSMTSEAPAEDAVLESPVSETTQGPSSPVAAGATSDPARPFPNLATESGEANDIFTLGSAPPEPDLSSLWQQIGAPPPPLSKPTILETKPEAASDTQPTEATNAEATSDANTEATSKPTAVTMEASADDWAGAALAGVVAAAGIAGLSNASEPDALDTSAAAEKAEDEDTQKFPAIDPVDSPLSVETASASEPLAAEVIEAEPIETETIEADTIESEPISSDPIEVPAFEAPTSEAPIEVQDEAALDSEPTSFETPSFEVPSFEAPPVEPESLPATPLDELPTGTLPESLVQEETLPESVVPEHTVPEHVVSENIVELPEPSETEADADETQMASDTDAQLADDDTLPFEAPQPLVAPGLARSKATSKLEDATAAAQAWLAAQGQEAQLGQDEAPDREVPSDASSTSDDANVSSEAASTTSSDADLPDSPQTVLESTPPDEGKTATATLGELYLRQGHLEEAEKIFRQVLQSDAQNPSALAGIRRVLRHQQGDLTAEELLLAFKTHGDLPPGLTAKKILVLKSYLQQLRGMGQDHV